MERCQPTPRKTRRITINDEAHKLVQVLGGVLQRGMPVLIGGLPMAEERLRKVPYTIIHGKGGEEQLQIQVTKAMFPLLVREENEDEPIPLLQSGRSFRLDGHHTSHFVDPSRSEHLCHPNGDLFEARFEEGRRGRRWCLMKSPPSPPIPSYHMVGQIVIQLSCLRCLDHTLARPWLIYVAVEFGLLF